MREEVWEQGTPERQNHTLRDLEISFSLNSTVSWSHDLKPLFVLRAWGLPI